MKSNTVKVAAALGSKQKEVLGALDDSMARIGGYGSGWYCEPSEAATVKTLRQLSKFYSIKDFGDNVDRTVKVVEVGQGRFELRERLNPRNGFRLYENPDGVEYEIEEPEVEEEAEEAESPSVATESDEEEVAAPAPSGRKGKPRNGNHKIAFAAIVSTNGGQAYVGRFLRGTATHAVAFSGKFADCVAYANTANKARGLSPVDVDEILDSVPGLGVS